MCMFPMIQYFYRLFMSISAVILTKNEEKNLKRCLNSLLWCDEIIVIDDESTDATKSIAQEFRAKVIHHKLNHDFSQQRNIGVQQARSEWIFYIDADEVVTKELQDEIEEKIKDPQNNEGFFVRRSDFIWGKQLDYGELQSIWLLRLAKKKSGVWQGTVHERWVIHGTTSKLKNVLLHYPHPNMTTFLTDINFYTDIRAKELYQQEVHASFLSIFFFPKAKFFVNYFLKRGYKDGLHGFVFAVLMSLHSFLVRAKLWQLWEKNK